jgi:hypothetical protein
MRVVTDPATIAAHKCANCLALWQGSWFLDLTQGFPWLQKVLGQRSNRLTQIRNLLREAILQVPGVVSVDSISAQIAAQRQLQFSFSATLNTGQQLVGGSGQPFLVN